MARGALLRGRFNWLKVGDVGGVAARFLLSWAVVEAAWGSELLRCCEFLSPVQARFDYN
jgi:hypothetical protein